MGWKIYHLDLSSSLTSSRLTSSRLTSLILARRVLPRRLLPGRVLYRRVLTNRVLPRQVLTRQVLLRRVFTLRFLYCEPYIVKPRFVILMCFGFSRRVDQSYTQVKSREYHVQKILNPHSGTPKIGRFIIDWLSGLTPL